MRRLVAAISLVAAVALPALAQRTTGTISGTVKDATGAVLPGVAIAVSGPNIVGSQTTTSNEQGFYRILNLPPGDYTLECEVNPAGTIREQSRDNNIAKVPVSL